MPSFSEYIDSKGDKYLAGVFTIRNLSPTTLTINKGWIINHQSNPSSLGDCLDGYPFDIPYLRQQYRATYNYTNVKYEIPYTQDVAYKPHDLNYMFAKSFDLREYSSTNDEFVFTINFKPKKIGEYLSYLIIEHESNGIENSSNYSFNGGLLNGVLSINNVAFDGDVDSVDSVDPFSIFVIS